MLYEEKLLKIKKNLLLVSFIFMSIVLFISNKMPDIKKLEEKSYIFTKDVVLSYNQNFLYRMVKIKDPFKALIAFRVLTVAVQEEVPRGIALSLVLQENPELNPVAINKNSNRSIDYGMSQLNSKYIDEFEEKYWKKEDGKFDKFNIENNVTISFRLLRKLYDKYNSWFLALKAYNGGESRVYKKTSTKYAKEILKRSINIYSENYS